MEVARTHRTVDMGSFKVQALASYKRYRRSLVEPPRRCLESLEETNSLPTLDKSTQYMHKKRLAIGDLENMPQLLPLSSEIALRKRITVNEHRNSLSDLYPQLFHRKLLAGIIGDYSYPRDL